MAFSKHALRQAIAEIQQELSNVDSAEKPQLIKQNG